MAAQDTGIYLFACWSRLSKTSSIQTVNTLMFQSKTTRNASFASRMVRLAGAASLSLLLSPFGSIQAYSAAENPQRIDSGSDTIPGGTRAYNPPADSRLPEGDHTSGSVRGCGEGNIAALAPRLSSIGQGASGRPAFIWYVFTEETDQLEFHLYRYRSDNTLETIVIDQIGPSQKGYMAYELPLEQAELATGETYLWQVVSYCDASLEDVSKWTSAEIEIVAPPADLALAQAETPLQQAQAYAQAGLWYDAIAAVFDATAPEAVAFRSTLLLELAELEAQFALEEETNSAVDPSKQLRQIAEMP